MPCSVEHENEHEKSFKTSGLVRTPLKDRFSYDVA